MLLIIDNYDSFTYNIAQMIEVQGYRCAVVRNDAISVDEALALKPCAVIISPGPGKPQDSGICLPLIEALAKVSIPVLGICLGYQAIGMFFGAKLAYAPSIVHGKCCPIKHNGEGIFKDIPPNFEATRYHSFILDQPLLPPLVPTASTDNIVMALKHKTLPMIGLQFHPESFGCHQGAALFRNFSTMYQLEKGITIKQVSERHKGQNL